MVATVWVKIHPLVQPQHAPSIDLYCSVVVDVATKGWNMLARKIVLEPTSCVLGPYGSYSSRSHEPSTWALCTVDNMEPKAQNQDSPHSAIKKVEKVIKVKKVYFETMVQHGQPYQNLNPLPHLPISP